MPNKQADHERYGNNRHEVSTCCCDLGRDWIVVEKLATPLR
jgi:hypothetical protein